MPPAAPSDKRARRSARLKLKWATDPEWRGRKRKRQNEWRRARRAADPDYVAECMARDSAARKRRYDTDPEYRKMHNARTTANAQARAKTRFGFIQCALRKAKSRGRERGTSDLTIEYLMSIIPDGDRCPVFPWVTMRFCRASGPSTASLDRVRQDVGYVVGNVRWVSLRANLLRRDATPDEQLAIGLDGIAILGAANNSLGVL